MQLKAGQRYQFNDEKKFALVISGKIEVYAVTLNSAKFRQMCLIELTAGAAVYPAFDDLGVMEIVIYAVDNSEIELLGFNEVSVENQIKLMRSWFSELLKLHWLKLLADRGDEMIIQWSGDSLFANCETLESLYLEFLEHEQIFSMLTGAQFKSEDKQFIERLKLRRQKSAVLIENSISRLIGEYEVGNVTSGDKLNETVFIVQEVAKALSMNTENISIAPEFVKRLDQVGIIRRLVQKGNMYIRLINFEDDWYQRDSGVMIGWYNDELAAFIPETPNSYRLITNNDPHGIEITEGVAKQIQTRGFICYAGLPNQKLTITDLLKFIGSHIWKTDAQAILAASFIAGWVAQMSPIITETIFTDIIPILDREGLVTVTQVSIVVACTTAIVSAVRSVAMMRIMTHIDSTIESALLGRLFSLPAKFFRKFQSGEIAARLMGIMEIKSVFGGTLIPTVFDLVFSVWSLMLMGYYSIKFTLLAIGLWIIYILIMMLIYSRIIDFERNLIKVKNEIAGMVQQIFTGLAKFRIAGAEDQAFNLWSKLFTEEWQWNLKLRWQSNYSTIITSVQPLIITLILYDVISSDMETAAAMGQDPTETVIAPAKFMAFYTAFAGFNTTINTIVPIVSQVFKLRPSIENLQPILDEVPEVADDKIDAEILSGSITVEHLTFSYTENTPDIIRDLSLKINAGENVAIVGKSGCGKSTFIRLLLGFEVPKSGAIYYDNQDLSELNLSSVRSQMGVVLQNGQLMSGDIFTNIVGTTALTMEDAWAAAEAAGIADDIKKMPMGMQTVISEGSSNISGGQRQRILIARALAAKPSILVFDEATSALDNRTQAIVTESLNKLQTTRIVIAHRLSTIKECDRIIVFDKGQIAESGTFDELVAQNGIFADLAKRQTA